LTFGSWDAYVIICLQFVLKLRHVMDPKRHFKRAGKSKALPKYFQVSKLITIRLTYTSQSVETLCILFCN
jgi:hypothetical protein